VAGIDFISASGEAQTAVFDWSKQQIRVRPNLSPITDLTVEGLTWDTLRWTTRGARVTKEGPLLVRSHDVMRLAYDPQRDFAMVRLDGSGPDDSARKVIESLSQTPKGKMLPTCETHRFPKGNGAQESSK
jgi:hypothetical protein